MSFSAGVFLRAFSWVIQRNLGFKILSAQMDTEDDNTAGGLNNTICRDGQSTIIANIPFGGNGITGLSDPVNPQDIATKNYGLSIIEGLNGTLISRLGLSNDAASPNTVLDIAAGMAASDDQLTMMILPTAFKKTGSSWAAGTGNGALDAGIGTISTWYHVFLIANTITGAVDVLSSLSATSPLLPMGYNKKRRIGSVFINASGNLQPFTQNGDEFLWATPTEDVSGHNFSTATLVSLTVPTGVKVNALLRVTASNSGAGAGPFLIASPDAASQTASAANCSGYTTVLATPALNVRTNTSGQVTFSAPTAQLFYAFTLGWIDTRGRNP